MLHKVQVVFYQTYPIAFFLLDIISIYDVIYVRYIYIYMYVYIYFTRPAKKPPTIAPAVVEDTIHSFCLVVIIKSVCIGCNAPDITIYI
jgi:hypothetical protein